MWLLGELGGEAAPELVEGDPGVAFAAILAVVGVFEGAGVVQDAVLIVVVLGLLLEREELVAHLLKCLMRVVLQTSGIMSSMCGCSCKEQNTSKRQLKRRPQTSSRMSNVNVPVMQGEPAARARPPVS